MKKKLIITICAFTDDKDNSVAYKKFPNVGEAVDFYHRMLEREDVNVISTRKVYVRG